MNCLPAQRLTVQLLVVVMGVVAVVVVVNDVRQRLHGAADNRYHMKRHTVLELMVLLKVYEKIVMKTMFWLFLELNDESKLGRLHGLINLISIDQRTLIIIY